MDGFYTGLNIKQILLEVLTILNAKLSVWAIVSLVIAIFGNRKYNFF